MSSIISWVQNNFQMFNYFFKSHHVGRHICSIIHKHDNLGLCLRGEQDLTWKIFQRVCEFRIVRCIDFCCKKEVSLSKLIDHLEGSHGLPVGGFNSCKIGAYCLKEDHFQVSQLKYYGHWLTEDPITAVGMNNNAKLAIKRMEKGQINVYNNHGR